MSTDGNGPLADEQTRLEQAVLEMVLELHPDHLTSPELVLKVAGGRERSEGDAIRCAIRELKCSGLVRSVGEVLAPTHAAVYAGGLLRGRVED